MKSWPRIRRAMAARQQREAHQLSTSLAVWGPPGPGLAAAILHLQADARRAEAEAEAIESLMKRRLRHNARRRSRRAAFNGG
ncbi:MAG: hypothetical protein AAF627_13385 [Myxococcota bacterium]